MLSLWHVNGCLGGFSGHERDSALPVREEVPAAQGDGRQ